MDGILGFDIAQSLVRIAQRGVMWLAGRDLYVVIFNGGWRKRLGRTMDGRQIRRDESDVAVYPESQYAEQSYHCC